MQRNIGQDFTTLYHTPSTTSPLPASSTPLFTSTQLTNIVMHSATSSASPERLWKFDVKNDIGFYLGNEDRIKGGNLVYLPYTHSVLTRGNSHRILISDQQLLQWYSRRRDIRQSPLPYCVVQTAILDLLADRATPRAMTTLVTPLTDPNDNITLPQQRTRRYPAPRNDNRTCATHPHQRHSTTPCDSHQPPQHTAPPERNNSYRTPP